MSTKMEKNVAVTIMTIISIRSPLTAPPVTMMNSFHVRVQCAIQQVYILLAVSLIIIERHIFKFNKMIYLAVAKFNDSCGSGKPLVIDSGLESGELTSPDYPSKYSPSLDCEWLINVDEGFGVQISFTFFDLERK